MANHIKINSPNYTTNIVLNTDKVIIDVVDLVFVFAFQSSNSNRQVANDVQVFRFLEVQSFRCDENSKFTVQPFSLFPISGEFIVLLKQANTQFSGNRQSAR